MNSRRFDQMWDNPDTLEKVRPTSLRSGTMDELERF
jgi:hypothetical protein